MKLSKYLEVVCLTALLVFGVQACGGDPPPAAPCPESQELCDGLCYDLDTTANHCGACGTTCAAGEVCNAGTCEFGCPTGLTECDGGCVDTQTSGTNCGACGAACAAGEVCDAGACSTSCAASAASIKSFDGMHPTRAHVVPKTPPSIITQSLPALTTSRRAFRPADPAPMMATSVLIVFTSCLPCWRCECVFRALL